MLERVVARGGGARRGNPSPGFSRLLAPTADLARRPSSGVGIDLRFCQTRPIAINQISARWLCAMWSQIATVIPAPTPAAGSAPCAVSETRRVSRAFCGQTSTHVDVPTARTTCAPTFSPSLAASVWRRARLLLHRLSNSLRSCSRLLIYRQQHLSNASGNFGRCPSGLVVHELLCACRCVIKARHACLSCPLSSTVRHSSFSKNVQKRAAFHSVNEMYENLLRSDP